METKDGYEKELNLHIERERAAVKLQSKVGELLYDKGIELVLFRNHLTTRSPTGKRDCLKEEYY